MLTRKHNDLKEENMETFLGKGENAGNQHFLLFQKCFLILKTKFLNFVHEQF